MAPVSSVIYGVLPPLFTVTASENVTVTATRSPALYDPFAVEDVTDVTVGDTVSYVIENCVAAVLPFPAASAATLEFTSTVTAPCADGVISAV